MSSRDRFFGAVAAIVIATLCAACTRSTTSPAGDGSTGGRAAAPAAAQRLTCDTDCTAMTPTIEIQWGAAAGILVSPKNLCVDPGTTITVKIGGNEPRATVATIPKAIAAGRSFWLLGLNASATNTNEFRLTVPGATAVEPGCYDYHVLMRGNSLDPRVTVRGGALFSGDP